MFYQVYLMEKLIYSSLDSDDFYLFIYKLKERVDNLTRSFNLVLRTD